MSAPSPNPDLESQFPSTDAREAALYAYLTGLGIGWKTHAHAPIFTVEDGNIPDTFCRGKYSIISGGREIHQSLRFINRPFGSQILRRYPSSFSGMSMWIWAGGERWSDRPPQTVDPDWVRPNTFVFMGLRRAFKAVDYDEVLSTFDRLLPLYRYVESASKAPLEQTFEREPIRFRAGHKPRARSVAVSIAARELVADLHHGDLQEALYRELSHKYGEDNAGTELPTGAGTQIPAWSAIKHMLAEYQVMRDHVKARYHVKR